MEAKGQGSLIQNVSTESPQLVVEAKGQPPLFQTVSTESLE